MDVFVLFAFTPENNSPTGSLIGNGSRRDIFRPNRFSRSRSSSRPTNFSLPDPYTLPLGHKPAGCPPGSLVIKLGEELADLLQFSRLGPCKIGHYVAGHFQRHEEDLVPSPEQVPG